MNSAKLLSIIIPIYNAEKYIATCLDSIVNQIASNVEILCIDDGSTDKSSELCNQYACKYSNVLYYRIENGGVSNARNTGMELAGGKYITFVDADDYVELDYIDTLIKTINGQDLIMFAHNIVSKNTCSRTTLIETNEEINRYLANGKMWEVWSKCFRKDIIRSYELKFKKTLKTGEDMRFVLDYIEHVQRYTIIDKPLYNYRLNNSSATHNAKIEFIENYCENYIFLKEYLIRYGLEEYVKIHTGITFNLLIDAVSQIWERTSSKKMITNLLGETNILEELNSIEGFKNRVLLFCMKNSLYSAIALYKRIVRIVKGIS